MPPLNNDAEEHIFLNIEEHISEESQSEEQEEEEEETSDEDEDVEIIENPEPKTRTIIDIEDVETDYDEGDEVDDDNSGEDVGDEVEVKVEKSEETPDSDKLVTDKLVTDKLVTNEVLEEDDDDEEGVFEIDINNVTYYTNDEKNGDIYEITEDGEPGDQIGRFIDGSAIFDKK